MAGIKSPASYVSKFLLDNKQYILDCMDIKNGLLDKLRHSEILTSDQYIKEATADESLIIDYIIAGTALNDVNKLLAALDETQHRHVANFIRGLGHRRPEFGDDWPLSCAEKQAIDKHRYKVVDMIDSRNGLLDMMLSEDCITPRQLDRLVKSAVDADRNNLLLRRMCCSSIAVYEKFLRCLIDTKQHHVVSILKPELVRDARPLSDEEQSRIRSNHMKIIKNLHIDMVFLSALESADCITTRQRQFVESAATSEEQCALLLVMIRRGSQNDFEGFIESLRSTGRASSIVFFESKVQQQVTDLIGTIKTLRDKLLMIIDVEHGLLDELLRLNVLTRQQVEAVRCESIPRSGNLLLDCIVGMSSGEQCERFLFALEESHQKHVANYIRSKGIAGDPPKNWPLFDSKSWVLSGNHETLLELIDTTNGLLEELVSSGCISSMQSERVATCSSTSSKNSTLLAIVQRGSVEDYDKLIDCLLTTKQCVVAALLAPDHVGIVPPLTRNSGKQLDKQSVTLLRLIATKNGLIQHMLDAGCITVRQKRHIETASSQSERNTRLLHVLKRGSQSDFDNFIKCLEKTKQQNVKNILTCKATNVSDVKTILTGRPNNVPDGETRVPEQKLPSVEAGVLVKSRLSMFEMPQSSDTLPPRPGGRYGRVPLHTRDGQ